MKPLVSVIVLTYNQQDTIARTLDSILAQRVSFPFEIVIGEDAGTDGTRSICEDYVRRYPDKVRLMPKAPNKGVVRNYFDTLEACRGEYIADCAGDDYWTSDTKLQRQADILMQRPEVAVVHTAWVKRKRKNYCLSAEELLSCNSLQLLIPAYRPPNLLPRHPPLHRALPPPDNHRCLPQGTAFLPRLPV